MQLVENKLVTMRTKELIKKEKKVLIPLWKEGKGGRKGGGQGDSMIHVPGHK